MMEAQQRPCVDVVGLYERIAAQKERWQVLKVDALDSGVNATLETESGCALLNWLFGTKPKRVILSISPHGSRRFCIMRDGGAEKCYPASLQEAITVLINWAR